MLDIGRRALAEARWEDARRAFEGAGDSPEALEGLGIALFWLEQAERSFELRGNAYRTYVERGERRDAARVATALALDVADFHGMAVANGWLQRAHTLLEGCEDSREYGWLALWEGHFLRALEHDLEGARARAHKAREIARELDLRGLELLSIALEGLIDVTAGNVRDGMRRLDEATAAAVAGEHADIESVVVTCCFLVHACERVCDWERAAQWGTQLDALATRWRLGSTFASCQAEHAAMLIGSGEWERAERDLLAAVETLQATRPMVMHEAIVQLADLRRRQGRIEEACELYSRCAATTEAALGLAWVAVERGDPMRAIDVLERLKRRPLAEKWVERALTQELLVEAHLALGNRAAAGAALAELKALDVGVDMVTALASLAAGHCAAADGDHAGARRHYEDAIDTFERCPAPWEAARTRLRLAATLRHLARDTFAREELDAAREAFRRLGALADERRADALRNELVPSSRTSPLTPRETDVLRLVARGLGDKEIAVSLRLSEHTVHRHVSNILGKLGLPSRAAAVATATTAGWLADSGHP